MKFRNAFACLAVIAGVTLPQIVGAAPLKNNRYAQHNLVADQAKHGADRVDPKLVNAWGIAIRPAGAGGHFWVTGKDISFEYVGDVHGASDPALRALHTDKLSHVKIPVTGDDKFSTGVVFSDSEEHFTITQKIDGAEPVTAPAKFMFAGDSGLIAAWTERKKPDGSFERPAEAITVIDNAARGAQYFGLAISADYSRLYAADFGDRPGIEIFGGDFKPAAIAFDQPFDTNKNGRVDPGEYAPFNIQALTVPDGSSHIFVAYAKTQACPKEEIAKGSCKQGELFAGEEDTSAPGYGRVAEFTESGKLVAVWKDGGRLSAPWGMAFAPANFGALSGALLVGNFGDGTIAAFDAKKRTFIDVMRDAKGKPVKIDKIWGILFGNGESLGDTNALYFAAGPEDEKEGLFGSLRPVSTAPNPASDTNL